jgi:hypothetical protein
MDNEMISVPISPPLRTLWSSLVSGVLMGLLELLGTPLSFARYELHPWLGREPHRAAGVRWCAAHGHAATQARQCGQGSSYDLPGPRASQTLQGSPVSQAQIAKTSLIP